MRIEIKYFRGENCLKVYKGVIDGKVMAEGEEEAEGTVMEKATNHSFGLWRRKARWLLNVEQPACRVLAIPAAHAQSERMF